LWRFEFNVARLYETSSHHRDLGGGIVSTLNLDHVVKMREDATFRAAFRQATLIIADGFAIVLARRLQGKRVGRVTGSELIAPISAEAARCRKSISLFGSSLQVQGVAASLGAQCRPDDHGRFCTAAGFDPTSGDARRRIATIRNQEPISASSPSAHSSKNCLPIMESFCQHIVCLHWRRIITEPQVRAPH
jgi:UDP-N-acetyl-D-mannosaminuronic acid transferase (WecB/TagA/CpsF family)